jgi:hypothetical protein
MIHGTTFKIKICIVKKIQNNFVGVHKMCDCMPKNFWTKLEIATEKQKDKLLYK